MTCNMGAEISEQSRIDAVIVQCAMLVFSFDVPVVVSFTFMVARRKHRPHLLLCARHDDCMIAFWTITMIGSWIGTCCQCFVLFSILVVAFWTAHHWGLLCAVTFPVGSIATPSFVEIGDAAFFCLWRQFQS